MIYFQVGWYRGRKFRPYNYFIIIGGGIFVSYNNYKK